MGPISLPCPIYLLPCPFSPFLLVFFLFPPCSLHYSSLFLYLRVIGIGILYFMGIYKYYSIIFFSILVLTSNIFLSSSSLSYLSLLSRVLSLSSSLRSSLPRGNPLAPPSGSEGCAMTLHTIIAIYRVFISIQYYKYYSIIFFSILVLTGNFVLDNLNISL